MMNEFDFILLNLSTLANLYFFIRILIVKEKNQFHYSFLACLFFMLTWSLSQVIQEYLKEFLINSEMLREVFKVLYFMGVCFLPTSIMILGVTFYKMNIKISVKHLVVLIQPILSYVLILTNDYHHLYFEKLTYLNAGIHYGHLFYPIHALPNYIFVLVGFSFMAYSSFINKGLLSMQSILIMIGFLFPLVTNILVTNKILILPIYITPISFSITLILWAIATVRYKFLNAIPIAVRQVFDRISDSVMVVDTKLCIIDYNSTYHDTFKNFIKLRRGVSLLELAKCFNNTLKEKEYFDEIILCINKLRKEREKIMLEKTLSIEGCLLDFAIELIPILDCNEYRGAIIMHTDVTELKVVQAQLTERERLMSLGHLMGGISHNLRTPLNAIGGCLLTLKELIREYKNSIGDVDVTADDHKQIASEMMSIIHDLTGSFQYMSNTITSIKDQASNLNYDSENNFTVESLIQNVELLMKFELKSADCKLHTILNIEPSTRIRGELTSLTQVMNNLITNAIHAYNQKSGKIILLINKHEKYVNFCLKDYGVGIAEEVKNKLFKNMITTKGKNGTGLGLYTSYSLIKGHFKGEIWFDSQNNKGTSFYVSVPYIDFTGGG